MTLYVYSNRIVYLTITNFEFVLYFYLCWKKYTIYCDRKRQRSRSYKIERVFNFSPSRIIRKICSEKKKKSKTEYTQRGDSYYSFFASVSRLRKFLLEKKIRSNLLQRATIDRKVRRDCVFANTIILSTYKPRIFVSFFFLWRKKEIRI